MSTRLCMFTRLLRDFIISYALKTGKCHVVKIHADTKSDTCGTGSSLGNVDDMIRK